MAPLVSVVMPVYNCDRYIGEAVASILHQDLSDLELIVVDDGSTDRTSETLDRIRDDRLRIVRQPNRGVAAARNHGLSLATGRYLAQMDADDLSRPKRLGRQAAFLDSHPNCGLVGTWAEIWVGRRRTGRRHAHPVENAELQFELLFDNPFVQSSIMTRRAVLDRTGIYSTDPDRVPPEDYELWSRIARNYEVANLGEDLVVYREVDGSISRQGPAPFREHLVTLCAENIGRAAGMDPGDPNVVSIAALTHRAFDRVLTEPDFEAMSVLLRLAASHVTGCEALHYEAEADLRVRRLRERWLDPSTSVLPGRGRSVGRRFLGRR